jgi:hypothetical protein
VAFWPPSAVAIPGNIHLVETYVSRAHALDDAILPILWDARAEINIGDNVALTRQLSGVVAYCSPLALIRPIVFLLAENFLGCFDHIILIVFREVDWRFCVCDAHETRARGEIVAQLDGGIADAEAAIVVDVVSPHQVQGTRSATNSPPLV